MKNRNIKEDNVNKGKLITKKILSKSPNTNKKTSTPKMIGQSDMSTFKSLMFELYKFMQQKYEVLQSEKNTPAIKLSYEQQSDPLGKTAYYDPTAKSITLYVHGRHVKDILRSCAHELIHHVQNLENRIPMMMETPDGYAQSNQVLRELEIEAFRDGNMCFRDWTDSKKTKNVNASINEAKIVLPTSIDFYKQSEESILNFLNVNKISKETFPMIAIHYVVGYINDVYNDDALEEDRITLLNDIKRNIPDILSTGADSFSYVYKFLYVEDILGLEFEEFVDRIIQTITQK